MSAQHSIGTAIEQLFNVSALIDYLDTLDTKTA